MAQRLWLAVRPPLLPASHSFGEPGQVMRKPAHKAASDLDLLRVTRFKPGENCCLQYRPFIYQGPVRTCVNLLEMALAAKPEVNFCTVGERDENRVGNVKILQEGRLPQQSYKCLAPGDEVLISLICGGHAEIKVGVLISLVPGIGSTQNSGHNALKQLQSGQCLTVVPGFATWSALTSCGVLSGANLHSEESRARWEAGAKRLTMKPPPQRFCASFAPN